MLLLQLLIIEFVNNIQESSHDDVNGGFYFSFLDNIHIIAYIMVYFITLSFYVM